MKLLKVDSVLQAREKLKNATKKQRRKTEELPIEEALGRTLAEDIVAEEPLPAFRKSTVDGYALLAEETQGVTENSPAFFKLIEKVEMGKAAKKTIGPGECVYVPTGGMIPSQSSAVVMVEYCEIFGEENIAVYDNIAKGKNIVEVGEDIRGEEVLIEAGRIIRPQEVGVLAAIGNTKAKVYRKERITIISTGDEIVHPSENPAPGQVRDINSFGIEALCKKHGLEIVKKEVLKDEEDILEKAIKEAMKCSDIVVVSGGSSQGEKDHTAKVLDRVGTPGVFTHGISIKPGKPTILGFDEETETTLVGLPGHPVAAMIVFELFIIWALNQEKKSKGSPSIVCTMEGGISAAPGKTTCMLVETEKKEDGSWTAKPILGKSGLITTLSKADGYTVVPENKEGIKGGEIIEVILF